MDDDSNINTINQSALEMLDRLKHIDADDRFALLEELGSWWFDNIDLEDELFVPDWKEEKVWKYFYKSNYHQEIGSNIQEATIKEYVT